MTRIALVEGLQKELAATVPWVERVIVVKPEQTEPGKKT
jgi:hypothetical protein